jgi:hypothetical protein
MLDARHDQTNYLLGGAPGTNFVWGTGAGTSGSSAFGSGTSRGLDVKKDPAKAAKLPGSAEYVLGGYGHRQ